MSRNLWIVVKDDMRDTSTGLACASYSWPTPLEPLDSKPLSMLWLLDAFNTFSSRNHVMFGLVAPGSSVNMLCNIETDIDLCIFKVTSIYKCKVDLFR